MVEKLWEIMRYKAKEHCQFLDTNGEFRHIICLKHGVTWPVDTPFGHIIRFCKDRECNELNEPDSEQ